MRLPSLSRPRSTDKCCTPSSGFSSENSILGRAEMKRLKKTGDLAPKASRYISIVQTVTVMCMIPGVPSLCKDPTSYTHRGISKWNPSDNPTSNRHSADKKGEGHVVVCVMTIMTIAKYAAAYRSDTETSTPSCNYSNIFWPARGLSGFKWRGQLK